LLVVIEELPFQSASAFFFDFEKLAASESQNQEERETDRRLHPRELATTKSGTNYTCVSQNLEMPDRMRLIFAFMTRYYFRAEGGLNPEYHGKQLMVAPRADQ